MKIYENEIRKRQWYYKDQPIITDPKVNIHEKKDNLSRIVEN